MPPKKNDADPTTTPPELSEFKTAEAPEVTELKDKCRQLEAEAERLKAQLKAAKAAPHSKGAPSAIPSVGDTLGRNVVSHVDTMPEINDRWKKKEIDDNDIVIILKVN